MNTDVGCESITAPVSGANPKRRFTMRTQSSTAKRLLKLITGIAMMSLTAASTVFAAPPNTEFLPTFQVETLTPASQANFAWKNVAPNALASYYTYQPMTTADAALVGFPTSAAISVTNPHGHICGRLPADATSTADCYIITVREIIQPMSLEFLKIPTVNPVLAGANLFPGPGLIKADGLTPFVDQSSFPNLVATAGGMTKAWGYGSGGVGWRPYGALGPIITGSAPATFAQTPISTLTSAGSNAFGDPAATGIWHFPAPTIKGTTNRPVYVQWLNELPNSKPVGHDPTVDCGDNAPFCYPYNRIVTHVHGAHVGPESDGLAVSWYTPNYALVGEGAFLSSNYAMSTNIKSPPVPIHYYPMSQEAGTIWYHDHAVGTTHNNTNMGMAGFFPVTDPIEKALQTAVAPAKPVLPSGDVYEIGLALQDRHFGVNGQMVFPEAATYDKNDPNCVFDANNNALPATCKRLNWMKRIGTVTATDPNPAVHLVPYVAGAPELTVGNPSYALNFPAGPIDPVTNLPGACKVNLTNTFEGVAGVDPVTGARVPFTQCAPFPATSATLEYFGNMPVVNGTTYAVMDVEPTVYRMRLIGGNDSRTWIAQMVKQGAIPSMVTCGDGLAPAGCAVYSASQIVPFYQVGSEQGLLTSMVKRNELDLMDGERLDVLVDFTGLGGTTVTMKNLGDDAPYSGRFDFDGVNPLTGDMLRQPTSVLIPEIMKFRVKAYVAPAVAPVSALAPVNGKALKAAYPVLTPGSTRTIALIEITDQYGRTMPTVDSRGYIPPGIRTTEVIPFGATEQWDIVNTTVDAHPMHIHLVAFETINRQAFTVATGFRAGYNNTFGAELTNNTTTAARQASIFTPSQYVNALGSVAVPATAYELGLKDTIQCPPGYVTRVKATYDIVGDYVWHCHILSHEEHDMMRPFRVTNAVALPAPASVTVTGPINGVATVTIPAPAIVPPAMQYVVQYKQTTATFWETNNQKTAVQTVPVHLLGPGTYQFRAQYIEPAIQNVHANTAPDSPWTAAVANAVFSGVAISTTSPLTPYVMGSGAFPSVQFTATGGVPFAAPAAPYTWTWAAVAPNTLPAGLTFVNGLLAGTPTLAGVYNFNVTACDSPDLVSPIPICDTQAFSLTVQVPSAITFTPANSVLAPFVTGSALSTSVAITPAGGVGAKTCVASAGTSVVPGVINTLPTGLTLSPACVLSGLPTVVGNYSFKVTATDTPIAPAVASTGFIVYTMSVTNPAALALSPVSYTLPSYTLGTAYTPVTFTAAGGNGAFTYAVTPALGTGLPTGSILNATTGALSAPTTAGSYVFEIRATDSSVPTAGSVRQLYAMTVNPATAITITTPVSTTLATGTVGAAITPVTFTAAGGIGALTINGTVLPAGSGLTFTAGVLSGTPTTAGTYTITVTGSDAALSTAVAKVYSMVVSPAGPVIPVAPTLVGPMVSTPALSPTYTWNAVAGATDYELFTSVNGVTNTYTPYTAAVNCVGATCSATPATVLALNNSVYWIVRAKNSAGTSPWSSSATFVIGSPLAAPAAPVLTSPTGAGVVQPASFTWPAVATATGYDLFTSIGAVPVQTLTPNVAAVCTVTTCTFAVPAQPALTPVYWTVRAKNTAGISGWATGLSFVTQ